MEPRASLGPGPNYGAVIPEWMGLGLAIAAALAVLFAGLFVAGERLFPTRRHRRADPDSGEWKRRREIRAYLGAIGERFVENHPVEGNAVAFYLPDRDVAITFDAKAYFRLANSETHAILVEHEMPGMHLGGRLPFETPEVGGGPATAVREPAETAFATLGLGPDAALPEVKAAYRERVKEAHPDHGGDEETFRRLREAYTEARRRAS